MKETIKQICLSAFSGTTSTGSYLLIAHFLDSFINPKTSNIIAAIIGAIINFILQSYSFSGKFTLSKIHTYIISEVFILGFAQLGFIFFLDYNLIKREILPIWLQKYYNTLIRIIVAIAGFFLISFPMRKYLVFV